MNLLVDIFEGFLGTPRKHNEDNGQIAFDCPMCSAEKGLYEGDGKGNLEINYNKGIYKCWVCYEVNHMHGSLDWLVKKFGTSKNLADYNLLKPDYGEFKQRDREQIIVHLPEGYKKLSKCTPKDYKSELAKAYLKTRGITDDIIEEFDIGYTIEGDFHGRIIIPSYDSYGNLNYFIARWFEKKYNKLKYINPQAEKQEIIFNESRVNWDATIYLVEGATDHIVTPNSIPLLGKFIPDKLLYTLEEKANAFVVIVLDDDAYDDAINLYNILDFGRLQGRIKICIPPDGYDPSKIHEILGPKGIIKLLSNAKALKN